jgi:predicted DNA-binding transcriptional regulator YafY
MERENRQLEALELGGISAKLRVLLKPDVSRRIEPDFEVLLEAEGIAARPGPKLRIKQAVVENLRHAIMSCQKVRLKHKNRREKKVNERLVHPYGFLHGHRNYLVCWHEIPGSKEFVLFSLPHIEEAEILDDAFVRDPEFSLGEYAARSFGVYQGKSFDTVWKFNPEAAENAAEFVFHPSQVVTKLEDGSLLVRFHAAGELEMAWHLYTWGNQVEVLEPPHLADLIAGQRVNWEAMP